MNCVRCALEFFNMNNVCYLTVLLLLVRNVSCQSGPALHVPEIDPQHYRGGSSPCYDEQNAAQRCVPDFINAAFRMTVEATNTCGIYGPTRFCRQIRHDRQYHKAACEICDARDPALAHPAEYLTDFNVRNNETWWQSETLADGIQYPNSVNLTLRLGKSYDITYIRLKFKTPRPHSFAVYKKTEPDGPWIPWQYFSQTCRATYGMVDRAPILPGNEAVAQCSKEYSDIVPLSGGEIPFSTLEHRPSAKQFEDSALLQEWVTATEILIVLGRLNTHGDEVFSDEKSQRSYYYAISDFSVGGRCKCNGHARECVKSTGLGQEQLVCRCEHNTNGADCEQCLPFFNDRPWRAATSTDANQCKECSCNGLANRCYFDQELFDQSGSGGHCIDCTGNTQGAHCEQCLDDHWRRPREHYCTPCGCNPTGSISQQCDEKGQCPCKPGVEGQFCSQCKAGFYDFGHSGCKDCKCLESGSVQNKQDCDGLTGECRCKTNVEGKQCDRCRPGYFHLSRDNRLGCTPCFCYGHTSICESAPGYFARNLSSHFDAGKEKWSAGSARGLQNVQWAELDRAVAASDIDGSPVYFLAPDRFLGDQRASYNQDLVFVLRVHNDDARPSRQDIIIAGADGQQLSIPIFAQENPYPTARDQTFKFRINANQQFQWSPNLNELDYIGILSNVSSLKIRATYSAGDVGFLSDFKLGSASLAPSNGDTPKEALWVEECECLEGFVGQFCESCAPGYRREQKFGGPFNRCVKCECHGHSESCDADSGACICEHHTAGDTCERCARGYFGNALQGSEEDCEKCPCPEEGPCILHTDDDIICTECPLGYSGRRCDMCADGYFGDPKNGKECKECECNGNIDQNSIGNCDPVTGECKKCVYNTHGFNCEQCSVGFWGDALLEPKGNCKPCRCFARGTVKPSMDYEVLECDQKSGQCECLPKVQGPHCDSCQAGFFNLTSGKGCEECNCDALGSANMSCDIGSGQCQCKTGIVGRRCDQCAPRHYGFSADGCKQCDCEIIGSSSLQCDVDTGQCNCRPNIEGRRCDRCSENMYDLQRGCLECDDCYTLIQGRVNAFRDEISHLQDVLTQIIQNPVQVNDSDFDNKLTEVGDSVEGLAELVSRKLEGDDSALIGEVDQLKNDLTAASELVKTVDDTVAKAGDKAKATDQVLMRWRQVKDRALNDLQRAQTYLETEGKTQWELAKEASEKYGEQSQRLSEIAKEARKLADKHENRSMEIGRMADETINASRKALNEAREAIFGGEKTSEQIGNLQDQLKTAEDVYNQTVHLAKEQLDEAQKANTEAAESLTTVEGLKLPNVSTDDLTEKAQLLREEAKTANQNAKQHAADNKPVLDQADRVTTEAHYQLEAAERAQQEADAMLADVDAAMAKAVEAVNLAEDTLKEANDTLATLIDFNENVENSKSEALEELKTVKDIETMIEVAENRTREAEAKLGNARADAKSAEEIAVQAEKDANEASEAANKLKSSALETKESAVRMKDKAKDLSATVKETGNTLDNYKKQADTDQQRADEAVTAAAKAENTAKTSNQTIRETHDKVKVIIDQLNSLDDVSEEELNELEKQLEDAKETLDGENLQNQVSTLKDKQNEQQRKISQYKSDIDKLSREVENIEEIRDSLPDQCFNVVNLEQEGHK